MHCITLKSFSWSDHYFHLERSYYAVGSSSTKSGIFDYLFEYRPRYFIIDELEKMNKKGQTSLLNLMELGTLSELKHNQKRQPS
jgi:Holliday junction DNA helicase RuvB